MAAACGVTEVTIRRDLIKLEARGQLRRTHGGAGAREPQHLAGRQRARPRCRHSRRSDPGSGAARGGAHLARALAAQPHPLLAESCYLPGAVYVGPNNYEAAFRLGRWTGEYIQQHRCGTPHVLTSPRTNCPTRARAASASPEGLRYVLGDEMSVLSVHGHGAVNDAYQVARDALALHPEINVIFGINDDSLLGALSLPGPGPRSVCAAGRQHRRRGRRCWIPCSAAGRSRRAWPSSQKLSGGAAWKR
ncbi:MAG: DeoR family transcriptional regulator [Anaerolineae bacterium]|nr:DeoR family transcriptional regulator [Anaerolineae bacterium]